MDPLLVWVGRAEDPLEGLRIRSNVGLVDAESLLGRCR